MSVIQTLRGLGEEPRHYNSDIPVGCMVEYAINQLGLSNQQVKENLSRLVGNGYLRG